MSRECGFEIEGFQDLIRHNLFYSNILLFFKIPFHKFITLSEHIVVFNYSVRPHGQTFRKEFSRRAILDAKISINRHDFELKMTKHSDLKY